MRERGWKGVCTTLVMVSWMLALSRRYWGTVYEEDIVLAIAQLQLSNGYSSVSLKGLRCCVVMSWFEAGVPFIIPFPDFGRPIITPGLVIHQSPARLCTHRTALTPTRPGTDPTGAGELWVFRT
jgi:hypothetical protein